MKKLLTILLILSYLSSGIVVGFSFYISQKAHRKSFKRHILGKVDKNELTRLVFSCEQAEPDNRLLRFVHADEFWFNGKLYDIVKKEYSSDSVAFYCVNDTDEELLIDKYRKASSDEFDFSLNKSPFKKNLLKFLHLDWFLQKQKEKIVDNCILEHIAKDKYTLIDLITEIPTPPPKVS